MPLLETRDLTAFYGDFQALFGISLSVDEGETIAIIGANGAGKSTFLKTIAGLLPSRPGSILFEGEDIGGARAFNNVRRGIVLVPEGRRLFPSLSVEENLLIGGYGRSGRWTLSRVYELFPILAERRDQPATQLSGGQQQMCAIGRALMADPELLLCDEISLGLAPIVIRDIYAVLPTIRGGRHGNRHRRAGHRAGARRRRPRLLLPGGTHDALRPPGRAHPRRHPRRLFRGVSR